MHDHVNSHFVKTAAASCSFLPSLLGIFDRASLPSLVKGYTETIIGSFPPLPFIKTERANACSFYRDSPKRNIFPLSAKKNSSSSSPPPNSLPRNEALFEEACLNYLIKPVPRTVAIFRGRLAGCRDFSWIFMSRPCIGLCSDRIIERYVHEEAFAKRETDN